MKNYEWLLCIFKICLLYLPTFLFPKRNWKNPRFIIKAEESSRNGRTKIGVKYL